MGVGTGVGVGVGTGVGVGVGMGVGVGTGVGVAQLAVNVVLWLPVSTSASHAPCALTLALVVAPPVPQRGVPYETVPTTRDSPLANRPEVAPEKGEYTYVSPLVPVLTFTLKSTAQLLRLVTTTSCSTPIPLLVVSTLSA